MRGLKTLLWLLGAACAMAQTRPAPPLPSYEVHRTPSAIAIDGKLDEPAWGAAGTIELNFPWESSGPKQKTVVRLLWDDNYLYVSYECEDSDITATHTSHDDPVDQDDSVLLLINPRAAQTHAYIGLEMNVRAVYHDYLSAGGEYFFKQFDMQGIRLATYIDGTLNQSGDKDRGWTLEVAIPWNNFDDLNRQHAVGTTWAANFGRWDGSGAARTFSIWSDSLLPAPNPHVPARFGQLVFVK